MNGYSSENKSKHKLYRIGMFAAVNRVTIKALRYYDEQDLLKPKFVDKENGYRYYVLSQMADLHQILALKSMGFSIEEIKKVKNGKPEKDLLVIKKNQIIKQIAELTAKLAEVESYLSDVKCDSNSHVLIKSIPEVKVASMKVRIDNYSDLFTLMPKMGAEMERLGCSCAMPEYCFTNYLEPGYKEEKILIETCESVTEIKEDSDIVKFKIFPEIKKAACIFHKGSYETLHQTYEIILKYIDENGYKISDRIRESYIDGVWNKDSDKDWLTEIQIPISK